MIVKKYFSKSLTDVITSSDVYTIPFLFLSVKRTFSHLNYNSKLILHILTLRFTYKKHNPPLFILKTELFFKKSSYNMFLAKIKNSKNFFTSLLYSVDYKK